MSDSSDTSPKGTVDNPVELSTSDIDSGGDVVDLETVLPSDTPLFDGHEEVTKSYTFGDGSKKKDDRLYVDVGKQELNTYSISLSPSTLQLYEQFDECPRYLRFTRPSSDIPDDHRLQEQVQERHGDNTWTEAFSPLSQLLNKDGDKFEDKIVTEYKSLFDEFIDFETVFDERTTTSQQLKILENHIQNVSKRNAYDADTDPGDIMVLYQMRLTGQIGVVEFEQSAPDFIILWPLGNGNVHIRVVDGKSAFKEQTYQQMQVSAYTLLLKSAVENRDTLQSITANVTGGVHYRKSKVTGRTPDDVPFFDLEPREMEVREMCRHGGKIHENSLIEPDDLEWQLNDKCLQCKYNEACGRDSISMMDTSILGISQGEQNTLERYGIETVYDLAGLATTGFTGRGNPTKQFEFTPRDSWGEEKMEQLSRDSSIAPKLKHLIQRSQTLIHKLHNGEHAFASEKGYEWLVGTGRGSLPDDEYLSDDAEIDEGSMIRVYLNVQRDHRRDVVTMVNSMVTSSLYYDEEHGDNDPLVSSHLPNEIGDTVEDAQEQEEELLENAFDTIVEHIKTVASETGYRNAPVHFYFYTKQEEEVLTEGLRRHEDVPVLASVRDLLGLRNKVDEHQDDQSMVSYVQPEVEQRIALGSPFYNLLPVWNQIFPHGRNFSYPAVKHTDFSNADTGSESGVNFYQVFNKKLFGDSDKYTLNDDGTLTIVGHGDDGDGHIETIQRSGAVIPLEYIWAVCDGGMTEEWYADGKDSAREIDDYLYRTDGGKKVQTQDVKELGRLFAQCVAHIERGINYKNTFEMNKKPIRIHDLEQFTLGGSSLNRACREFIELEHRAGLQDSRKHYGKEIHERVRSGKSTYVRVENVKGVGDNTYFVRGRLLYDKDPHWNDGDDENVNWKQIAEACRIKDGGETNEKGDYMIANTFGLNDKKPAHNSINEIKEIESGTSVRIRDINLKKDEDVNPSIVFEVATRGGMSGGKFSGRYNKPAKVTNIDATEEDMNDEDDDTQNDNTIVFQPNGKYVLDPGTTNVVAENQYKLLGENQRTMLVQLLENIADGNIQQPTTDAFDSDAVDSFIKKLDDNIAESPNKKQQSFITETDSQISMLQGPPGTGKTSGALAPALLSRAFSFDKTRTDPLVGLVSGPSNTAVKEVIDDVDDLLTQIKDVYPKFAERVSLVRLVGNDEDNPYDNCEYINMSETSAEKSNLFRQIEKQKSIVNETDGEEYKHTIVFTTSYRHKQLFDQFGGAVKTINKGKTYFDLLAVDEASMLRLPEFVNLGSFLNHDAQILVSGDHRQMPPVLKHDWERETRRTVKEIGPYLSTLNYLRYLDKNETVEHTDEYVDEIQAEKQASIPMARLERTYRCHKCVTGFLREYLYDKYDGINYHSEETDVIDTPKSTTDGVDSALRPDGPLTLIIHDDLTNNQSSYTEVDMIEALTNPMADVLNTSREDSPIGVVTPHNAQKGLLNNRLPSPLIDTVERFQGGDKQSIIVSATVSDPDFLKTEEEFILNPNRLNVAMSRMEEKLIVIAARSIFRLTPQEPEDFKRSLLWKFLYREVGGFEGNADWDGSLDEFVPGDVSTGADGDASVEVYTLNADHFN